MRGQGLKDFIVPGAFALFAPAGTTPRPIIDRVHAALVTALTSAG